jgi:hypothetical protein
VLAVITAPRGWRCGVGPASQRALLRLAGESKTGNSPRTPSIVSRTCKPRPAGRAQETGKRSCTRASFRLLTIRAPRQAVLRTSSGLAPSRFTSRTCDLPVEKTRDASNRCLPPKRTTCTRISRVPGSLAQLSPRGRPTEAKAPCSRTGGPDVSRRPGPLRRIVIEHVPQALHACREWAWAFCSHGADAIEPLTLLSRSPKHPRAPPAFASAATWPFHLLLEGLVRVGGYGHRPDPRYRRLVKAGAS